MKWCLYPARGNKFSSSGIEGDNVHPWVLLLGSPMVLSEDRTQMQHLGNGSCAGSCGSWACWRAGARRENCWARKPHGSVYWAEIPDVFTGFWAGGLGMSLPRVVLQSSFPCWCDGCGSQVSSLPLVCVFRVNGII